MEYSIKGLDVWCYPYGPEGGGSSAGIRRNWSPLTALRIPTTLGTYSSKFYVWNERESRIIRRAFTKRIRKGLYIRWIEENPIINISHNERSFYIFTSPLHSAFASTDRYHPCVYFTAFFPKPHPAFSKDRMAWRASRPEADFQKNWSSESWKASGRAPFFFTKLTRFKASDGSTVPNVVFSRGKKLPRFRLPC